MDKEKSERMNKMHQISQLLWGKEMICILLGISFYFMLKTKFVLYRKPFAILKSLRQKEGLTSLWNALGSSLGVGSISGVSSALMLGGSGALIWMMISAIFGMMLKYVEIVVGLASQKKYHHRYIGGCMMIFHHTRLSFLGVFFAICCIGASFGIGNVVPMQAMKDVFIKWESVPIPYIAMAFGLLLWFCLWKDGSSLMKVNEQLVPLACVCYVLACLYLIIPHYALIPQILKEAFLNAFGWQDIGIGVSSYMMAQSMRYGFARGVFSHEAGMGSSPLAYTSQVYQNHHDVALLGVVEVFFDTLVVCFLSALVLLCHQNLAGNEWMYYCFMDGFGFSGGILFGCIVVLFAFPCIIGWFQYGSICCAYLSSSSLLFQSYRFLFWMVSILSFFLSFPTMFLFADMMNALMILPNLISLLISRKYVIKYIKELF